MREINQENNPRPAQLTYPPDKQVEEIFIVPRAGELYEDELHLISNNTKLFSNFFELLSGISGKTSPLVLLHVGNIDENSLALLSNLHDLPSHPRIALLFDKENETHAFSAARRLNVGAILPDHGWRYAPDWHRWLRWAQGEDLPTGLTEFFTTGAIYKRFPIGRIEEKSRPVESLVKWAVSSGMEPSDIYDFRLAMEEMINNSLYHAFSNEFGGDKYTMQNFKSLEEGEEVVIEYAVDDNIFGLRAYDTGGRLSPDIVMERILNQLSMHGLMDENGRGLFLLYTLSSRLFIRTCPSQQTDVIVLFFRKPEEGAPDVRPVFALNSPPQ